MKITRSLTGFHAAYREGWLARNESYLPVEDNSVCPFCGWDCRTAYGAEECPRHPAVVRFFDFLTGKLLTVRRLRSKHYT